MTVNILMAEYCSALYITHQYIFDLVTDEDLTLLRGYLFIVVSKVSFWLRWFAAYEMEDDIWKVALKRPEASCSAPPNNIKSDHHNSIIFQEQKNSEQSVAHLHKTPRCNFVQNIEMH